MSNASVESNGSAPGPASAGAAERRVEDAANRAWSLFQRHPILGSVAAGGAVLAAAAVYGVSEAAIAVGGGYLAYRALARRRRGRTEAMATT
jgi:hypothetical protein